VDTEACVCLLLHASEVVMAGRLDCKTELIWETLKIWRVAGGIRGARWYLPPPVEVLHVRVEYPGQCLASVSTRNKGNRLAIGTCLAPGWRVCCMKTKSEARLSVTHLKYAKYTVTTN
jgi:hypothetical protein